MPGIKNFKSKDARRKYEAYKHIHHLTKHTNEPYKIRDKLFVPKDGDPPKSNRRKILIPRG